MTMFALDLALAFLESWVSRFSDRLVGQLQDRRFWESLLDDVAGGLRADYDQLEAAENAHGELLVVDERFFRDTDVRAALVGGMLTGDVDSERLRERFTCLYGADRIDLFDRNLADAVALLRKRLEELLSPAERVAHARLQAELAGLLREQTKDIKRETGEILANQAQTRQMLAEHAAATRQQLSDLAAALEPGGELAAELQAEVDQCQELLREFRPRTALDLLVGLKERAWDSASATDRFRLLTYMGIAHLHLNEEREATRMFSAALDINPDSARALCNAALGALLQGDVAACQARARQSLEQDPTMVQAYAMLVYSSSEDEPFASIVGKVPEIRRETVDVAMALGKLALGRGLLADSETWFRVAIRVDDRDLPEPRAALADALLDRLIQDGSIHPVPGLVNPRAAQLSEALELYNAAWARVSATEMRSPRLGWLVNRATVRAMSGDTHGAIRDLDEVLRDTPDDPGVVKNRAMLAYRVGDLARAASLLRGILERVPDAHLWLSIVLYEDGKLGEAEDLAHEFLQLADPATVAWRDAAYVLILTRLRNGKLEQARIVADRMADHFPDDLGALALRARVARYEGQQEEAESLLTEAESKVSEDVGLAARLRLADELYEAGRFEAAAGILERITDTGTDSELTRRLLLCYYRLGNLGPALEICSALRREHGPLRFVTEMESAILEETDQLGAAERVCLGYLALFPDDSQVQLRLAAVRFRQQEFVALDGMLDQNGIDPAELSLAGCAQLVELYLARGRARRALEMAYEARRRFYSNPEAHLLYVRVFLRRDKEADQWLAVRQVAVDTVVTIDRTVLGTQPWMIIEDRSDADPQRNEFPTSHPLVRQLLGRQVGDTAMLSGGPLAQEVTVVGMSSKFVHAFNESLEAYQALFPDVPGVWRIQVRVGADGSVSEDGLRPILDVLEHRWEIIREVERAYQQGMLTVGSLAQALGMNPVEVHCTLMNRPDTGIRCCSGRADEREKAVALVRSGSKLIADATSLMTLHVLGVGDAVVKACGKLGVVRSSLELFERVLSDLSIHRGEYWTLGKEGDQYYQMLVTEEVVDDRRRMLRDLLDWARAHCDVLPVEASLAFGRDRREQLADVLGRSFAESVLVAAAQGAVLYSDDLVLRLLARGEFDVEGVWTQAVLMDLRARGAVTEEAYVQSAVRLLCANYRHTSIDGQILLESARQAQWRRVHPFTAVTRMLEGDQSDAESAAAVAAGFVRLLWDERLQTHHYEWLVEAVLDAIVAGRCDRRDVVNRFRREIRKRFFLAPLEVRHLEHIIRAWTATRVF